MAVTVNFKTASKRVNSTGVVGGDVTAVSCIINEPCSIENPQVILRNGGSAPSWNYCEISEFGRSYWGGLGVQEQHMDCTLRCGCAGNVP